jgi:DNA-binding winged helix-turn-helix (wHTH) protein/tetratricopeptide (TPR) repeat protein
LNLIVDHDTCSAVHGSGGIGPVRSEIHFPPYRLDLVAGFLRSGDRAIALRPKTWAVLCYLAERPGVLVTKEEILNAVWGGVAVTEATLTKSIGEIRDALHDEVRHPRFVETVHRRGFRFVSAVDGAGPVAARPAAAAPTAPPHVVARDGELRRLHELLALADAGFRQTVFVTGEAGIGKTTLVEAFLATVAARSGGETIIAAGQCVRRHSGEEPLMPVLEAVGRLARGPHAARVVELLRQHAPAWLVQLPWLVEPAGLQELRATLSGTTAERMLRVFAHLVEELTTELTLVLVLEDLHWADPSTVDLLSILAQRPERARLLLLGSYRPAEAIVSGGPFDGMRRLLGLKHRCVQMPLDLLPLSGVEAYLAARFGGHKAPTPLAQLLHTQTEGNPLFLATAVDYLIARGCIEVANQGATVRADVETLERHIPGSLRDLVEAQLLDLEPFQVAVLEAASAVGLEFGAQAVAAALEVAVEEVEDACERLVRGQRFLRATDTEAWPDGAVAARYVFTHALYQRLLYHRIPAARRRILHGRIGARLEVGFGTRASDVAAELAAHFERSTDPERAVRWLQNAAASAEHRFAQREAAGYMRRALGLLDRTPDGPERRHTEFQLTASLGAAVIETNGFAADEAWAMLTRAHALGTENEGTVDLFQLLYMMLVSSLARADAVHTPRLADELARAAAQRGTAEARLVSTFLSGDAAFWEGRYAEAAILADVARADPTALDGIVPGVNPVIFAQGLESLRSWLIGRADRAVASTRLAIASARSLPNPINVATALFFTAQVALWRGNFDEALLVVDEGRALAGEHGFGLWQAALGAVAGEIAFRREDSATAVAELEMALAGLRSIGMVVYMPSVLRALAEALLQLKRLPEGFAAIDEGLEMMRTTLLPWQAPELWRVRGELLAARGDPREAVESSFARAIEIAHGQGAVAFELRATTALARQLSARGRKADARARLGPVYDAFIEGLDTADVRAARALLRKLGA